TTGRILQWITGEKTYSYWIESVPFDHSGISPCGAHDTSLYKEREAFLKIFSRSFRWLRAFGG
ncbi:hypothetical protein, partial [Pseudomonas aeruginosa]|uniref:hypothetical protein n=1 Tax=Pseudomonas aeruginosa TaxID=287 RepID=UPI003969CD52